MKKVFIYDKTQGKLVEWERRPPEARIHIIPDIQAYMDENLGQHPVYVRSRRHKMSLLKERGLAIK